MVWKVKFFSIMLALLMLVGAICAQASAATFDVYEGTPSNTYIQYFKDSVANIPLGDHYVAFRSDQYSYTMVVGDISFNNGIFTATDSCTVYTLQNTGNYNSYYNYTQSTIDSFSLNPDDKIIYSDLGGYPQFEERSAKYEILTTILIVACCVGFVCRSVFYYRPR